MVVTATGREMARISGVIAGGRVPDVARAAAERLKSEFGKAGGPIFKGAKPVPGRVMAVIASELDIQTFSAPEESKRATWISLHRRPGAATFEERERRMVELFHSQSAWLLVQLDQFGAAFE